MTEQCKIYLDPWDKNDLEGTAMLIDRIPDTYEATYRGVTCQRWLVRFMPDQDNAKRWLDYTDAEAYVYPIQNAAQFTFSLDELIRNDASPSIDFPYVGQVKAIHESYSLSASFIMLRDGRLAGASICYSVDNADADAAETGGTIRINGSNIKTFPMIHSLNPGGPYYHKFTVTSGYPIATGNRLTLGFYGTQPPGKSVWLRRIIATVEIEWGDFT